MDFGGRWRFNRFSIAKKRPRKKRESKKLSSSRAKTQTVQFCAIHAQVASFFAADAFTLSYLAPYTFAQKCSLCEKLEKFCLLCMRSIVEARAPKAKVKDDIGARRGGRVGLMLRFAWRGWVECEGADMHFKCNSLTAEGFFEAIPCLFWPMRGFLPFLTRRLGGGEKSPSQIAIFQHMSMQGSHRQLQSRSCAHN